MKRLVRSKSGSDIYGPKYRNTESIHSPKVPNGAAETNIVVDVVDSKNAHQVYNLSNSHDSMYIATLEGDCEAAEMLLERLPTLATDEITEEGDRALHVAAAMKHQELVGKLVEKIMNPRDLASLDGHGYTACCYAAILGTVEIADLMMRKNPTLAFARDRENKTPLHKAVLHGNTKMVFYLLKSTNVEYFSMEEWFDLLLMSIRGEMYDVASEICGSNEQLATMRSDEGTALHVLATQPFFKDRTQWIIGVMKRDFWLLANKLWECIQRLGKTNAVEILKNPSILHFAAEMGNVELITMITQTYPNLVWHTNREGYTIFHIAVIHRKGSLFQLIEETGAKKDLIAASQDEDGNNILHLAAKQGAPIGWKSPLTPVRLREEIMWFEEVKLVVPRFCLEMKNRDGHTPHQLFMKEHKRLLEKNTTWTMNTADSWKLISTLIFSVVFASAFAVPGGYDQETGTPTLSKSKWFTCFIIFEALAICFSVFSVLRFSRAMTIAMEYGSTMEQLSIKNGLIFLSLSFCSALSVFVCAYFMIYVEETAALTTSLIIIVYVALVFSTLIQNLFFHGNHSRFFVFAPRNQHSLFKKQPHAYRRPTLGYGKCHRTAIGVGFYGFVKIPVSAKM